MAIVIKARAMHARGTMVSGGVTGAVYFVDADTGHLRMVREGAVGEVDVLPDDARELLSFPRDYEKVVGVVPPAAPPAPPKAPKAPVEEPAAEETASTEEPPAEDGEPTAEESPPPPPPPPPSKKKVKVIALPADDVWTIAEWCDEEKTGVELTAEEMHTRPKADLVKLVREKAKALRHS